MISCLLLVLSAGSAFGGVSIQMPYLHPAGVTYSNLAPAVHDVPSHLAYSAATTSSVAYGNAAFLAGRSYSPAVAHVAAPVAHIAAPIVPTVHHVPAVAQVPVTKYEAHPAYVQNLVDVAKPKLATRKIEIRRPAIQKEFYDVEERVLIRPAGSAVVELDQPVSKNQRGPTVVQPAFHGVATHAAAPVVGFRALHAAHHVIPAFYPGSIASHPYPIQGPAAIPVSSTPAPPQEIEAQPEELPQQYPEQGQPQQEQQQFTQQIQEQLPQPSQEQIPQQIPEQQQFPQQEPQQFDDSDSVAVDNPDIARLRSQQPQQQQPQQQSIQQLPQPQDLLRRLIPQPILRFTPQQQYQQQIQNERQLLAEFAARVQQRVVGRQQSIARSQVEAQEQVVAQLQAQAQAQQAQLQRSQQILQLQQQQLQRSRQAADQAEQAERDQQSQPAPSVRSQSADDNSEGLPSVGPAPERQPESRTFGAIEAADLRSALINNVARSSSSPNVIPSVRISPEQSLSNQERLISLLTARGGVVEARSSGQSDLAHQVRARVLSVTPAPDNAAPREEKVNTRRIVVSRPIQTVEEVDVVEPFTKIERVAVNSPALIKTARLGVAHVPTSLPVHGYAHAAPAFAY